MARNKAYKGGCGGRRPPHVDMLFFQGPKPYAVSRAQKSLIRHWYLTGFVICKGDV